MAYSGVSGDVGLCWVTDCDLRGCLLLISGAWQRGPMVGAGPVARRLSGSGVVGRRGPPAPPSSTRIAPQDGPAPR